MDPKSYFVRPFEEADYPALSRLSSIVAPETPSVPEQHQHWDQVLAAGHFTNERWVAVDRETGEVVAFAEMNHSPYSHVPHKFWVTVVVDPVHRRRGVGRALSSLLESEAALHRASCFWTMVRKDDPIGIEFAEKLGFSELRTTWMSVLDLSGRDALPPAERATGPGLDGIRFTTLAAEGPARPEVRQRLFELMNEASRDVPRMGEYTPIRFDQFVAQLDGPSTVPEAYFLACHETAYVAMSNLERDLADTGSLIVGFTGTRPAYRGRGLASELKRRALEYARRRGIRYLRTFNDSLNRPIWAINAKLGFRRQLEWSNREKQFVPTGTSPAPSRSR